MPLRAAEVHGNQSQPVHADSARDTSAEEVHPGVQCDGCEAWPITGAAARPGPPAPQRSSVEVPFLHAPQYEQVVFPVVLPNRAAAPEHAVIDRMSRAWPWVTWQACRAPRHCCFDVVTEHQHMRCGTLLGPFVGFHIWKVLIKIGVLAAQGPATRARGGPTTTCAAAAARGLGRRRQPRSPAAKVSCCCMCQSCPLPSHVRVQMLVL